MAEVAVGSAAAAVFEQQDPTLTAEYVLPELANIIVPPPDLRPIVEKTAGYVAKHGTAFEAVILSKQQNDRRFDFLHPDNAYHSYYKSKLVQLLLPPEEQERLARLQEEQEAERQALEELEAEQEAADARAETAAVKPVVLTFHERLKLEIARSCQAHLIPTSPATLDRSFTCVLPYDYPISPRDRDIILLTARYVAAQGRAFINGLMTREARNPSFDFMRSSHPCYQAFQESVQAYEEIMTGRLAEVLEELKEPDAMREKILGRIEYERIQEKLMGQKEQQDEDERMAIASTDWYDFVVLRTVDFPDDEQLFLPSPFNTIEEINRALDAQEQLQADRDVEMDVDADAAEQESAAEVIVESQVQDTAPGERQRVQSNATQFQKCPSCGELVRQSEISEHVRICLLDPRWKVQKQASMQKQRDSNLISGSDIGRHLSELARRRQDIFTTASGAVGNGTPGDQGQGASGHSWNDQVDALPPSGPPPPMPIPPASIPIPYMPPLPSQNMGGFPHAPMLPQGAAPYGYNPVQTPVPYMGPAPGAGFPHAMYQTPVPDVHIPQVPPPHQQHHHVQPPPPPPPKRTRMMEPAAEWARRHPGPVHVVVQLPQQEDSEWNLANQQVPLSLDMTSTVLQIKQALSSHLNNLQANKMKLQAPDGHWLKDSESLAEMNYVAGSRINFELKERGRKK